jgi:hypothetical protein
MLDGYEKFISAIRENEKTMSREEAMKKAVEDCIKQNILKSRGASACAPNTDDIAITITANKSPKKRQEFLPAFFLSCNSIPFLIYQV